MAIEVINRGTSANDGTGDNIREAFRKVNDNFDQVLTNDTTDYTDATTPLAGTEIALVEQGGTFKKVAVSEIGGENEFNSSLWVSDKLTNIGTAYFTRALLNSGNTFGGSVPNTGSFKTMSGFGIMSGTNANGGARYSIEASNTFVPTSNLSFYSCFYLGNITRDNFIRIGFLNSAVNTNTTLVTDGFWLQINTANVTLNTADNGISSQSSSTPLSAGLYYEMLLEYISSTEVRLKIKEVLNGNVIFNQTLTTNIPTTAKQFRPSLIATITTAGVSTNIISLQEMSFGIKPSFLNNF